MNSSTKDMPNSDIDAVLADLDLQESPSVLRKLEKWLNYPAMGNPVWPSRFVPTKMPLTDDLISACSASDSCTYPLTVQSLVDTFQAADRKLGMILNLAGHDCLYYEDMPEDVRLHHVRLTSKMLPTQSAVREVISVSKAFWKTAPDSFIAIHCAYGFNRTGFTLCCYLIEEFGLSVEAALASFAYSRPPGIRHEKFVNELHSRYHKFTPRVTVFDPLLPIPFYTDALARRHQLEHLSNTDAGPPSTAHEVQKAKQVDDAPCGDRDSRPNSGRVDARATWESAKRQSNGQLLSPSVSHHDLLENHEWESGSPPDQSVNNDSLGPQDRVDLLQAIREARQAGANECEHANMHTPEAAPAPSPGRPKVCSTETFATSSGHALECSIPAVLSIPKQNTHSFLDSPATEFDCSYGTTAWLPTIAEIGKAASTSSCASAKTVYNSPPVATQPIVLHADPHTLGQGHDLSHDRAV